MTAERVNPFGDLNDLSDFAPAPAKEKKPKPIEKAVIDQVAEANDFPSRQPAKPEAKPAPRPQRRYTTGRNQQINVKATSETIEKFYRIADELNAPLGEVLARALDALEKATK
jgi:hypothetical protein